MKRIAKYINSLVFDQRAIYTHASKIAHEYDKSMMRRLCCRISIDRMRIILDEAEASGATYTTLGRLLEDNYNKKVNE